MRIDDLHLLVSGEAVIAAHREAPRCHDDVLVVVGGRPARRLRRRGYDTVRYVAYRHGTARVLERRRLSPDGVLGLVRGRRRPAEDVVVASKVGSGALLPPAVGAAGGGRVERVTFSDDERRRAAFMIRRGGSDQRVVVKVARAAADRGRAPVEQRNLAAASAGAGGGADVPRPLGYGIACGHEWAAETMVAGRPFRPRPGWLRARRGWTVLDGVAAWLGDLAEATAHPAAAANRERVALVGRAADAVGPVRDALSGTVAVMAHGDLASGDNVLVDSGVLAVIDWETAIADGWPLLDLLPTLALGAARLAGCRTPQQQAGEVLALCRGERSRSVWLFQHVRSYLDRIGISTDDAGPIAAVAWGHQASMRARHDALLVASGGEPAVWTSAAELVFERWMSDERLGRSWQALLDAPAVGAA